MSPSGADENELPLFAIDARSVSGGGGGGGGGESELRLGRLRLLVGREFGERFHSDDSVVELICKMPPFYTMYTP